MIPLAATIRSNRLELHRRLLQILGQLSAGDRPLPRLTHEQSILVNCLQTLVSVRPERLQDLTEDEAKAEGIRRFTKDGQLFKYWSCDPCGGESKCAWADLPRTAVEAYAALWDRINPKQPWSSNPWVWRIEFERKESKA